MATTTRTRAKTTTKRKKAARKKTTAKSKTTTRRKAAAKGKTTTRRKATGKKKTTARRKTTAKAVVASSGPACSISKAEFKRAAERLHLQIGSWGEGAPKYDLEPREFSSGSFGWFASEKLDVPVGSKRIRCQMSLNVTVIGSKNRK